MKTTHLLLIPAIFMCVTVSVFADTFAAGTANEFEIDFVDISGDTNPTYGYGVLPFGAVNDDYRMGKFEITNDQWTRFKNSLGIPVTGVPSYAHDESPTYSGANMPTNEVSWYEAAQFVNWLNTSTGHQAAYKFTGTQGTSQYTMSVWDVTETDGTNLYRHKDAYYFLPTEDEWVKAAYWNGTNLQTYATVGDAAPTQDGWNYYDNGFATDSKSPWAVGSGSEELNGTYDMMGNIWEWTENPYYIRGSYSSSLDDGDYVPESFRAIRGGPFYRADFAIDSFYRSGLYPYSEHYGVGFRVASVPEPCSLVLLGLGSLALQYKKTRQFS